MTPQPPDRRPLIGTVVRLDATVPGDDAELFTALDDPRVWAGGFGGGAAARPTAPGEPSLVGTDTGRAQYTVRLVGGAHLGAAGTVVGTTSLGDVVLGDERLHLGWTGYHPSVWGSPVNPECKLLLLGHAFDDCRFGRVKIQTDLLNPRSQAAIAKLGATREGVLRRHKRRADGTFRDTVVFSVLAEEWPAVAAGLRTRLGR